MSENEPFLTRWSRLKQETAKGAPAPSAEDQSPPARTAPDHEASRAAPSASDSEPTATETFDPASLPPLDSIAAGTDIRAFLARGVPPELTRAALRRAWAADPAIRDFIGLSENSWDFTAPDGVPGFGPMRATDDLRELLAQVGRQGPGPAPASNAESGSVPRPDAVASQHEAAASPGSDELPRGDTHELVKGGEEAETAADQSAGMQSPNIDNKKQDVAARNTSNAKDLSPSARPRGHGGALPR
jgi:hypothetical protein